MSLDDQPNPTIIKSDIDIISITKNQMIQQNKKVGFSYPIFSINKTKKSSNVVSLSLKWDISNNISYSVGCDTSTVTDIDTTRKSVYELFCLP